MKKWLLVGLLLMVSLKGFSQTIDTLGIADYRNGTPTLYTSPNGGFAFGNNGYNDRVKAQSFSIETPVRLNRILIEFGEVIYGSANPLSVINVNVYNNYGSGIMVGSGILQDSVAPDSILTSIAIPISQLVDDGSFSIADLGSTTFELTQNFSIGIDVSQLAVGDTVGLISTTDGDANGSNSAWELTADSVWFQVAESSFSWGLDIQLAIFPVVEYNNPAAIIDRTIQVSFFPNPCSDILNVDLPETANYRVELMDATGRSVLSTMVSGMTNRIDVSSLETGVYIMSIIDDSKRSSYTIIKE